VQSALGHSNINSKSTAGGCLSTLRATSLFPSFFSSKVEEIFGFLVLCCQTILAFLSNFDEVLGIYLFIICFRCSHTPQRLKMHGNLSFAEFRFKCLLPGMCTERVPRRMTEPCQSLALHPEHLCSLGQRLTCVSQAPKSPAEYPQV
jgi:hypothetical protein